MRRLAACVLVILAACGDNKSSAVPDGGDSPDAVTARCGNLVIEDGEDCDDGNRVLDSICDADCHFTCGNGLVDDSVGEQCDTAIASGPGSCPASCDDNDACTTDILSGSECSAMCVSSVITAPADGDGCCPTGADANSDNDCSAMCGNGVVEAGELCDTGITAGAGACPTTCNDGQACTTDALVSGNSCQAHCTATAITAPANSDGCCPAGATSGNDNDCLPSCNNGVVDPGETCDTAIANGNGKCPTTCSDNMACTRDVLSNPGTCTAACAFPAITMAMNGDGCCPTGANANNDNDCQPHCGNGVKEGTEQCDDGNMTNTDACSNGCTTNILPTGFRFDTLALKDPHAFAQIVFLGCSDITNGPLGMGVNDQLSANLTGDKDMDGLFDLSPTLVFRPLDTSGTVMSPLQIYFADCTTSNTVCRPGTQAPIDLTATNQQTGTCLAPIANTTHPYNPAVTNTTGPCFVSGQTTVTVTLGGVDIVLHDAKIAATYMGTTKLLNGLLMGFVSETDANNTVFPANLAVVGGKTLASVLPGGTGSCKPAVAHDKDTNNGVSGWWFYLNFTAPKTTWSDN